MVVPLLCRRRPLGWLSLTPLASALRPPPRRRLPPSVFGWFSLLPLLRDRRRLADSAEAIVVGGRLAWSQARTGRLYLGSRRKAQGRALPVAFATDISAEGHFTKCFAMRRGLGGPFTEGVLRGIVAWVNISPRVLRQIAAWGSLLPGVLRRIAARVNPLPQVLRCVAARVDLLPRILRGMVAWVNLLPRVLRRIAARGDPLPRVLRTPRPGWNFYRAFCEDTLPE